jgi:polar amino acid transport system permease protein
MQQTAEVRQVPQLAQLPIVRARHPWQWVAGAATILVAAYIVLAFASSPNIAWEQVAKYLTAPTILSGVGYTIFLTVIAMALGISGGVGLAVMRLSRNRVLQAISGAVIWLFRGTPLLIQIIFWYNIALVFPNLGIGIPFTNVGIFVDANQLVTPTVAALLALSINESAYMSEIVRGGILSVDPGQAAAATSIGMRGGQSMRHVVLPQAFRAIVPATGNQFIGMLKTTSLVSVIAASELMTNAQQIYAQNYFTIELLLVASAWYLFMTSIASIIQSIIERRLSTPFSGASRARKRPRTATNTAEEF